MTKPVNLPIGIEDFEEIRKEGFYYVDKTGLIIELLNNWKKVNLFTRPRRFGKSLNMSMLKYFLEYGCDASLFEGLMVASEQEICEKYMGKFPVVSITLKDVNARDYETARGMLCSVLRNEVMKFQFLSESERLSDREKLKYAQLADFDTSGRQGHFIPDEVLADALLLLTRLLQKHCGQKVILLIDEYDVPLDKARQAGYYDEMLSLLRSLLSRALKGNESLYFAVLTGCLQISKESIFTGLNNFCVFSITDVRFQNAFGFTKEEVKSMLHFYGFDEKYELVKEWYDGYCFGKEDIYCPWDVINYIDLLRADPDMRPKAFWVNSSGNDIIKNFLKKATPVTRRELEELLNGGSVKKKINQELTYRDLYKSIDNLWSILFTTGYLTKRGEADGDTYELVIPNREIAQIYVNQIGEWFQEEACSDMPMLDAFCAAFRKGDAEMIEKQFTAYLKKTISVRDTSVRKERKENFYHGILLGLLSHYQEWDIDSNAESGNGFSDILVEIEKESIGIVIEVKYSEDNSLEAGCQKALEQIEQMGYEDRLKQDGMHTIFKYGIACNKKSCKVKLATGSNK